MTTSYSRTREQLASMVLRKLRVVGEGMPASGDDLAIVLEGIDLRLKELQGLITYWWKISPAQTDVALTAGTQTATAPADMFAPVTLQLRINSDDYPIEIVDHGTFQQIQTKTERGQPCRANYQAGTFRLWPVPDSNYTAKLTYEAIVNDTEPHAQPDIQIGAINALAEMVMGDLADDFSQPEQRTQRLKVAAIAAERRFRSIVAQRNDTVTTQAEYL